MSTVEKSDLQQRWFPVCSRADLQPRHILETALLGQDLAVWRGSAAVANVWENRCPHRGMRLTVGVNMGAELRCAYHGYRFASGSATCTTVPAQPERTPPRSLCIKSYPVREAGNLIWTRLAHDGAGAELPLGEVGDSLVLYAVAVRATPSVLASGLAGYRFRPSAMLGEPDDSSESCETLPLDDYNFRSVARNGRQTTEVRLFLQPVDTHCTVLHGIVLGSSTIAQQVATLRHHALQFDRLRETCERVSG